jgi:hypothetical protein
LAAFEFLSQNQGQPGGGWLPPETSSKLVHCVRYEDGVAEVTAVSSSADGFRKFGVTGSPAAAEDLVQEVRQISCQFVDVVPEHAEDRYSLGWLAGADQRLERLDPRRRKVGVVLDKGVEEGDDFRGRAVICKSIYSI